MALQFRPYFDDNAEQRTNEWSRQLGQDIAGIGENFAQGRQQQMAAQRQAMLDKYMAEQNEMKRQEHERRFGVKYPSDAPLMSRSSQPTPAQTAFGGPMGSNPLALNSSAPDMPFVKAFESWKKPNPLASYGFNPEQEQATFGDLSEYSDIGSERREEARKLFDAKERGLDRDSNRELTSLYRQQMLNNTNNNNARGQGNNLRQQFLTQSKDFSDMATSFQRVVDSSVDPSPAGDIALIYNYMKMLDPGSTVREGEFATAQNAGSIPQNIQASYNKALNGERLAPSIRTDFVGRAEMLYKGQEQRHMDREAEYRRLAQESGASPDQVIVNLRARGRTQKPGGRDDEAVAWARANPQDPRSAEILRINGQR
jgi:hypothetical protein